MPSGDVLLGYLRPTKMSTSFVDSLNDLTFWDLGHDRRIDLTQVYRVRTGPNGIPAGRNTIARALLDGNHFEWLFFIDADMGFEPDTLDRLLAVADPSERPIVGGLCFAQYDVEPDGTSGYRTEPRPTIYRLIEHPDGGFARPVSDSYYPVNMLVEAQATGTACLLIHRSVVDALHADSPDGNAWFDRIKAPNGDLWGEDISFCMRARVAGFPIWVHTGVRTTHHKEQWLAEPDFWRVFPAPPATESVDVIVPVLHRPQNVKPFMESLRASTGLAEAWFVCEPGDDEVRDLVLSHGGHVIEHPGTFAEKVNHAYRELASSAPPWVFLAGDDVEFRAGWLDHAQFVAKAYDAAVIGTNDLGNPRVTRGEHATHMLIRRSYIDDVGASWDGPGSVCHEGYRHWYVDDEIVTAARQRGTFQMALGSIVEHMHPLFGKGDDDDVYKLGQSSQNEDRRLYSERFARYVRPMPEPTPIDHIYRQRAATPSDIHEHLGFMHDLVVTEDAQTVVELGVRSGNSTAALLAAVEKTGGHLWSVDIATPVWPREFHDSPHSTLIVGDDLNVAEHLPERIDVLFIDTSHTYEQTRAELVLYGPKAATILLHDTELEHPYDSPETDPPFPVKQAVQDYCDDTGRTFENRTNCYGLGIIR